MLVYSPRSLGLCQPGQSDCNRVKIAQNDFKASCTHTCTSAHTHICSTVVHVTVVKHGKDRDEDDQVDVWCFPERKTAQH